MYINKGQVILLALCNIAEGQDHIWIFDNDVSKPWILLSMYKQVFHTIPIEHSDLLCNTKVDWFGQGCGKNFPVIKRNTFSTIKRACYISILFITAFLIRIITQTSYKTMYICMLYTQQNDTTSLKITRQNHTLKILRKIYPLYDTL